MRACSCEVCKRAVSSSFDGFCGEGFAFWLSSCGGDIAFLVSAAAAVAAVSASSSISLTFIRVSSTNARINSACVARRVLKGKVLFLGSFWRRTWPS